MTTENTATIMQAEAPKPADAPAAAPAAQKDLSLHEAMADHLRSIQSPGPRAPKADEATVAEPATETSAEPAAEAAQDAATEATAATQAQEAKKAEEPASDERAKALAEYVRGKRAVREQAAKVKAESDRVKAESAKLAEERTKFGRIAELQARAERDPVGAVEEFLGKGKITGDTLLQLLDRATGTEPAPMSEEEKQAAITEAAIAKVKADLQREAEEKAKAKEAEQKEADERGKAVYFGELGKHLEANADKYPLMASEGWDTTEMSRAIEAHQKATGQWPTNDQVLFHFEDLLTKQTERRQSILAARKGAPAVVATPAAKPSPASAPVKGAALDSRGKPGKVVANKDPFAKRDEIAARLDGR